MAEEKLIDPALLSGIGVIVGAALTQLGSIISQHFANKREAKQWERQHLAAKEERYSEREKEEKQAIGDVYHKCLLALSTYISDDLKGNDDEVVVSKMAKDIQWYSWLLAIQNPNQAFLDLIDSFDESPSWTTATNLREYVLDLTKKNAGVVENGKENNKRNSWRDSSTRRISFLVSEAFQKQQMIDGIEFPRHWIMEYDKKDLPREHRKRLLDIYFDTFKGIPAAADLVLPTYKPSFNRISCNGGAWEASLNPNECGLMGVLDAWGKEYDRHLKEAESSLRKACSDAKT